MFASLATAMASTACMHPTSTYAFAQRAAQLKLLQTQLHHQAQIRLDWRCARP